MWDVMALRKQHHHVQVFRVAHLLRVALVAQSGLELTVVI